MTKERRFMRLLELMFLGVACGVWVYGAVMENMVIVLGVPPGVAISFVVYRYTMDHTV